MTIDQAKNLKIGDLVVCISIGLYKISSHSSFTIGTIYEVGGKYYKYNITHGERIGILADDDGIQNGWPSEYFEQVTKMEFKDVPKFREQIHKVLTDKIIQSGGLRK